MSALISSSIRLARTAEAAEIAAMSRDYIEHGFRWRWRTRNILSLIRDPATCVIVAPNPGGTPTLRGFAAMHFKEDEATLYLLAVRPEFRRQQTAVGLLRWLHKSAHYAGCYRIQLTVRQDNPNAQQFYVKLGYRKTAVIPKYYDGKETAHQMTLELRPAPFDPAG